MPASPHYPQKLESLAGRAKTTILIPAFNQEQFIANAIESVLRQTEPAFRLLIVDDGSEDRTHEIAKSFLKDPRLRLLRQAHRGPGPALQMAIKHVKTPFAVRLDGDDELLPNALKVLQGTVERQPSDIGLCFANHIVFDQLTGKRFVQRGHQLKNKYDVLRFVGPMAPRIYRVSALRTVGGWSCDDPCQGRFMEDRLLEIKLAGRFSFHWIDQELYLRRFHGQNQSSIAAREYGRLKKWAVRQALKDWKAPYKPKFHFTSSSLRVDLQLKKSRV